MLTVILENLVAWTTIIANIVTSLGIVAIFFAVVSFAKNRFTKKTFLCKIQNVRKDSSEEIGYFFDLHIVNFTDNDFFISRIQCIIDKEHYPVYQSNHTSAFQAFSDIMDIEVKPHMSNTVPNMYIDLLVTKPIKAFALQVETTIGTLNYILDVSDFRDFR